MPPLIDARTIYVASAVVFGGLVVSVALAWRELRTTPGPERFARSYVVFLVGLLLFALRGRIPDVFSMTAANVLVIGGAALVLEGTKLFFGLRPGRRVTAWSVGLAFVVFGYFSHVRPDEDVRTVLSSAGLAGLLGAAGWTAWHRRPRGGVQVLEKVTALALSLCAALFWARAVAIGAGVVRGRTFDDRVWMAVPPLLCVLCAVVWTMTLLANASRRLTGVVQAQNGLLANLLEMARAAGSEASLDTALGKVLESARALTGATGSSLLVLDEQGRLARGLFGSGHESLAVGLPQAEALLDRGLAGWVARHRESVALPDVDRDSRWLRLPAQEAAVRSALCVPISSGTVLVGVLTLVHSEPSHFGEEQKRVVESTTPHLALALRSAQVAEARLRATRGQALLNAVLEVSARHDDAGTIADEAARAVGRSAAWARVFLALPGEDGRFRLHGRTDGLADERPGLDDGVLGRAFRTGETQRGEVRADGSGRNGSGSALWRRLAVPLRHLGRTLGVACFEGPAPRTFDAEEVALAEAVAEAVSLGLGKAALARAREELTRMMVHDLRGPISGQIGALELLRDAKGLGESDRKLLDAAERNTRRQLDLVDGILELARLEVGALPVLTEDSSLGPIVVEALRTIRPAADARRLTVATDLPADLPDVRVDPSLVVRVLENLVGNAVKFSDPGNGGVRVEARLDGAHVTVKVRDSGPGVEEWLRPRIFEKFTVGSLPGRGSGLGLPFCRLAIEALGGRIWLEHPERGAVFAFTLPRAASPSG